MSTCHKLHKEMNVVDVTFDDRNTATNFVNQHGFNWPVLPNQQKLINRMGIDEYPMMVLVGADGHIHRASVSTLIAPTGSTLSVQAIDDWVKGT